MQDEPEGEECFQHKMSLKMNKPGQGTMRVNASRLCNNSSVECSGLIDAGHRLFPRWIDATQTITKETKR